MKERAERTGQAKQVGTARVDQERLMREIISRMEEIAVSHMPMDDSELDKAIDSAQEVPVSGNAVELHVLQNPPVCYASALGMVRSNTGSQLLAGVAASDHKLPSPRFGAFHVIFSDEARTAICIPKEKYESANEMHYRVTWLKDGSEWRCGMAALLKQKGWMAPVKKAYEVPVFIRRNHPKYGSCLVLWFKEAELVESEYVRRKKSEEENAVQNAARAAAKAAAEAATKGAAEAAAKAAAKAAAEAAAKAAEEKAAKAAADAVKAEEEKAAKAAAKAAAEAAKAEAEKTAQATDETKPSGSSESNA